MVDMKRWVGGRHEEVGRGLKRLGGLKMEKDFER